MKTLKKRYAPFLRNHNHRAPVNSFGMPCAFRFKTEESLKRYTNQSIGDLAVIGY